MKKNVFNYVEMEQEMRENNVMMKIKQMVMDVIVIAKQSLDLVVSKQLLRMFVSLVFQIVHLVLMLKLKTVCNTIALGSQPARSQRLRCQKRTFLYTLEQKYQLDLTVQNHVICSHTKLEIHTIYYNCRTVDILAESSVSV